MICVLRRLSLAFRYKDRLLSLEENKVGPVATKELLLKVAGAYRPGVALRPAG
jgi:hypothetical protein